MCVFFVVKLTLSLRIISFMYSLFLPLMYGKAFQNLHSRVFSWYFELSVQWNCHLLLSKATSNTSAPITAHDLSRLILNVALAFLQAVSYVYMFKKLILSCCSWRCTRSQAEHRDRLECSHTRGLLLTLSEAQLY